MKSWDYSRTKNLSPSGAARNWPNQRIPAVTNFRFRHTPATTASPTFASVLPLNLIVPLSVPDAAIPAYQIHRARACAVNVTDIGRDAVDVTVVLEADATTELRLSVALPAAAVALPVKVSVHTTAPALVTEGALQDAMNPFGNPDATLIVDPTALPATANPPIAVPVTVTVAVPSDCIVTDTGATASLMAGAC
jgi:hypothetical protein